MSQPVDPDWNADRQEPAPRFTVGSQFEIGTDGVSAVVVGFDGTDPSRDAIAFAAGIARRSGGRLIAVYVVQVTAIAGMSAPAAVELRKSSFHEAEQLGREVQEAAATIGLAASLVVREGDPAREIELVAAEERADLIVVGRSHSRTHVVMGSVAGALVRHAQRPVCVVP